MIVDSATNMYSYPLTTQRIAISKNVYLCGSLGKQETEQIKIKMNNINTNWSYVFYIIYYLAKVFDFG